MKDSALWWQLTTRAHHKISVESQLQGERLRWLGHVFRMPNDRLPQKLLFGEVKGLRPRSSFNDVIVKTVVLVGLIGMHKTGYSEETRLVLHVPSSS